MTDSGRIAITRYFGEPAARAINTYIEGASTHLALHSAHQPVDLTRAAVRRLASGDWDDTPLAHNS